MFHIQFSSQKNHLFVADIKAVRPPRHPESVVDTEHLYWELLGVVGSCWEMKPQPATGTESQDQLHEKENRKNDVEDLRQDHSRMSRMASGPICPCCLKYCLATHFDNVWTCRHRKPVSHPAHAFTLSSL